MTPNAADDALLLVIDIQERLAPQVADQAALVDRTGALLEAARLFGIPSLLTEHCPDRIGPAVGPVRGRFDDGQVLVKTHFSALDEPGFADRLHASGRRTVVVCGMEAHVCVLQTVLALRARGFAVVVVGDAVGSRAARQADRQWALARMAAAGCVVAGTETVLFEWTGDARRPEFRVILGLVKSLA